MAFLEDLINQTLYGAKPDNYVELPKDKPVEAEKPMPYIYQGAQTPAEAKFNVPVSPEADKLVLQDQVAQADKPMSEPTWTEKLAERYNKELDQRDQERKMILNQWRKEQGMAYEDETGKQHEANRGLLGISGFLDDRPNYQKKMLMDSLSNLNRIRFGANAPKSDFNAPTADAQEGAKIMQELGISKMQGLQGMAGMGKEIEAERRQQQLETPGNVRATAGIEFLKSFPQGQKWISDLAAKAPGGEAGLSAADIDPYVKYAQQMGLGQMKTTSAEKIADKKLTAQQQKDDEKFSMWLSGKLQAKIVPNPDRPGEYFDKNMGITLPPDLAAHYRRLYEKEAGAGSIHLPSSGGGPGRVTGGPGASSVGPTAPAAAPAGGGVAGTTTPAQGGSEQPYSITEEQERYNIGGKHVQKQIDGLANALDPTKNGGISMRNALEAQRRAQNMRAVVKDGQDPLPMQLAELAIALNSVISGRTGGTAQELKELLPHGLEGDVAKLEQYFKSEPVQADMRKWVDTMLAVADREARQNERFVKDTISKRVAGKDITLSQEAPRKRDSILRSNGLDPAAFHSNGTIGDYTFYQPPQVDPAAVAEAKSKGKRLYYDYKDRSIPPRTVMASSKPAGTFIEVGE